MAQKEFVLKRDELWHIALGRSLFPPERGSFLGSKYAEVRFGRHGTACKEDFYCRTSKALWFFSFKPADLGW